MIRFLIFAEAASYQGSDAYTITEGHVCCHGAGKATDMVGMVTAPDTVSVMFKLVLSTVIVTMDQAFTDKAWEGLSSRSLSPLNPPEEMRLT